MVTESGIYRIRDHKGRCYIGSAFNFHRRWQLHRSRLERNAHNNRKLQAAWNKYGQANFVFEIIEYADREVVLEREQYYLDRLEPHYNLCLIAGAPSSAPRGPMPQEWRDKIRAAQIGKTSPARKAAGLRRRGQAVPQAVRDKVSATKLANPTTPPWLGKKRSAEDIAKFRASHLGKKLSPESIAKREATKRANRAAKLSGV